MNGLPEAKRAYRNEPQLNECYISVAIYLNLISTIKQTNQNQLLSFFDHSQSFVLSWKMIVQLKIASLLDVSGY